MAIFISRAVPKTIIGSKKALALRGNGRFARFANLTGTELLERYRDAKLRLATKVMSWVELSGPQPAYAHAVVENGKVPTVEIPNVCYSTGKTKGSGEVEKSETVDAKTMEEDLALFNKLLVAGTERFGGMLLTSGSLVATIFGALMISGETLQDLSLKSDGVLPLALGLVGLAIFIPVTIFSWRSHNKISNVLVNRFKTRTIPPYFYDKNSVSSKFLEQMIKEAK